MPTFDNQAPVPSMAWRALAWFSIGLGAAGAVLPLLPTTPFLLLAAWAAPKCSPQLDTWLHTHPAFGSVLRAWRDRRAVPVRAKCMAILLLVSSWIGLWLANSSTVVLWLTAILFCSVAIFLLTRPNGGDSHDD